MKLNSILTTAFAVAILTSIGLAAPESDAALKAEAKITKAEAQKIALSKAPKGKIVSSELEKEKGHLVWSFDIAVPGTKDITEVLVDAKTGKIVATENETPAQQAKEKEGEKKEKKAPKK